MSTKVIIVCKASDNWFMGEWRSWTQEYVGEVLPNLDNDGPDVISLSTDLPVWREFPRRIIAKKDIVSIKKFETQEEIPFTALKEETKEYQVAGSKGDVYTVKQIGNKFTCDCVGFSFRQSCKHIISVKEGKV